MSVYLIDSYYLLYLIRTKANRTFVRKFVNTLDLSDDSKLYSPNIIFSLVQIARYLRNKNILNKIDVSTFKNKLDLYNIFEKITLYTNLSILSRLTGKKNITIKCPEIDDSLKCIKNPEILGSILINCFCLKRLNKVRVYERLLNICLTSLHNLKFDKYKKYKKPHKWFILSIGLEHITDLSYNYKNKLVKKDNLQIKVDRIANKYSYLRYNIRNNYNKISFNNSDNKMINDILLYLI
tara:strand:- start:995 stop:1708 length:714 start_codon:yes stop_codon:yes gene_type:complete